jgi:hypothetical protein
MAMVRPLIALGLSLLAVVAAAYEAPLTLRLVTEAITVGQSAATSRRAFHASYRFQVNVPPVDYVEVVTPFRRVALEAESRLSGGPRGLSQREGLIIAAEAGDGIEIYVEFTFHPLNTFIGVPDYEITLLPMGDALPILPAAMRRVPRFGARIEGTPLPSPTAVPTGSAPLTGGTLVAAFDGKTIDRNAAYEVVVGEKGSTLTRVRVDLERLR